MTNIDNLDNEASQLRELQEIIAARAVRIQEWFPKGTPEEVRVYDFLIKSLGKAALYGVNDLFRNEGWVSVGTFHPHYLSVYASTSDFGDTALYDGCNTRYRARG